MLDSPVIIAWGVSNRPTSLCANTSSDSSDKDQYLHCSLFVSCWPDLKSFFQISGFYFITQLFFLLFSDIEKVEKVYFCINNMPSMNLVWSCSVSDTHTECAFLCVVSLAQSKQWSLAKWRMEKLHLCKWPLGAVLSVLEGLQGYFTHTHTYTYTHTHTLRNERVSWRDCGVVTLLMGPYGHKTNTNCSSSPPVIRSWKCWSQSDGETSWRKCARGCGLKSPWGRSITHSISFPHMSQYGVSVRLQVLWYRWGHNYYYFLLNSAVNFPNILVLLWMLTLLCMQK